jgi:hypothetical protein
MDNFVDLRFEHAVYAHAIYIFETFNPGTVHQIWGGDGRGRWACLHVGMVPPSPVGHQPRSFSPPIRTPEFPINTVRLIFNNDHLKNFSEIEAVALLGVVTRPNRPHTRKELGLEYVDLSALKELDILSRVKDLGLSSLSTDAAAMSDTLSFDLSEIGNSMLRLLKESEGDDIEEGIVDWDNVCGMDQVNPFQSLPGEVILHVFSFLDLISLGRCAQVCNLFREVFHEENILIRPLVKTPLILLVKSGTQTLLPPLPQVPLSPSQRAVPACPLRKGQVPQLPRPLLGG